MDVQAVIVPGVGVAACQAGADNTRQNQMLVYDELKKGTPPAQIIEMLKKDPDMERRQFGIVAIPDGKTITPQNNRAGFNGTGNSPLVALLRRPGTATSTTRCRATRCSATRRLPGGARLLARDRHARRSRDGGDGSGGCQRRRQPLQLRQQPLDFVPCDNKTSHVAYIAIAKKDDEMAITHNDGKYFAYIAVGDNDIKKGESANPVKTLRMRYNTWVKAGAKSTAPPGPTLYKPQ